MIIEDNELDSTDAEDGAKPTSNDVGAIRAQRDPSLRSTLPNQEPASELSEPIDLSASERWYDVEAGSYIDKELPLGLEPEVQEGLTTSTPARDYLPSPYYDSDRNTQRTVEEPTPRSLPEPLEEDSSGESDDNVSELEKDLLLAFEEQEKSSVSPPSAAHLPRCSIEPSHPQIDQVHNQSGTSYGGLEELGPSAPTGPAHCSEPEQGEWGGERRHQDTNKEIISDIYYSEGSDRSHETSDKDVEDDEAPRLAKRQKLRSTLAHEGLPPQPQNLTPSSATQLEDTSRCDNQLESQKSSSPSPMGDEEPTSNVGAAY